MKFSKIENIDPLKKESWENKIFLTFDIDWCHDEVLQKTLDILSEYNIESTMFCTHETSLLNIMAQDKKIELGIHPNFNPLLEGNYRYGKNVSEVTDFYLDIVPNAKSVRSHSLTQGGKFLSVFEDKGIKFECNSLIDPLGGLIFPYNFSPKIIKVPHIFEDDVREWYEEGFNLKRYTEYKGIKVFAFHPVQVFLNTESMNRYNEAKPFFQNPRKLHEFINKKKYGTKDFLLDIIRKYKS